MIGEPHPDLVSINVELALQPGAEPQQAAAEDEEEGQISNIHIHNLYNPVRSADTIPALKANFEGAGPNSHHIVVGDFNAHHPLWESRVRGTSRHAHSWVEAVDDLGLSLLTPRDCPTYESREGRYSTIDLAWATDRLAARLVQCASLVDQEPSDGSDHIPVTTTLDLAPVKKEWPVRFNLRKCDAKQLATAVELAWQRESETLQPIEDSEGVEVWAAALQRAVRAGLEESAPLSRGCARSQPWFEHGDSRAMMNKARREWQTKRGDVERKRRHIVMGNMGIEAEDSPELDDAKCEAEVYRMRYIDVKREHHTSIGRAKKEYRKRALAAASGKDLWQLAKLGKGGANASMVAPLAMPEGGLATQAPAKAQILRTGFWPDKPQRAENDEDAAASEFSLDTEGNERGEVKWESLGDREIAERIAKSKKGSAPGPDGASWEALGMIMRGWDGFVPVLRRLFNKCLEHGCHPTVFKAATTVVLRKPGKPDYTATGAYRPIALLNVMGKLLEALVAARILTLAERAPLLSNHHFGGRPHRSTEDALLQFQQFIDDSHRNKRHVLVISADVSGAYNGVMGKQLVRDLEEAGWPQPVIRWAASFMKGRSTALRLGDYTSQQMDLPDGLPQGSPVSQLLWLAYSRGLADALGDRRGVSIAWVDDINIAVASADLNELEEKGQEFLNKAEAWAREHEAGFDNKKTKACILHRPRLPPEGEVELWLMGSRLPQAESVKILGVTFQADGKFTTHTGDVVRKATSAVHALLGHGNRAWGFGVDQIRQLYEVGVVPIMTYASTVWVRPLDTVRGSGGTLSELAKVQRLAALRITGAYRSTATDVLNFEAGILPVDLKIFERQQKAFVRLIALPETHPLVPVVERAKRRPVQAIPGPLHLLCRAYPDIADAQIPRSMARDVPGSGWLQLKAAVSESKEEAIEEHRMALLDSFEDTVHVYTDGSGIDGRFGAATYAANGHLAEGGYDGIKIPLGTKTTVYRAETAALHHTLATMPAGQNAHVWSDSQALLRAINGGPASDYMVRAIQQRWEELGDRVRISWIPGHMGVIGNEAVDEEAKEAARMPCDEELQEAASLKLAAARSMWGIWQGRWDEGVTGRALRKVNKLKVGETRKLYRGLSRATVSLVVQLRTGHIGLNRYLKWRKVTDDARCPHCNMVDTREHVLFECIRTRSQRRDLEEEVGPRKARSTWALLNDRKLITKAAAMASARLPAYHTPA